jgi:hypothetical protein
VVRASFGLRLQRREGPSFALELRGIRFPRKPNEEDRGYEKNTWSGDDGDPYPGP